MLTSRLHMNMQITSKSGVVRQNYKSTTLAYNASWWWTWEEMKPMKSVSRMKVEQVQGARQNFSNFLIHYV